MPIDINLISHMREEKRRLDNFFTSVLTRNVSFKTMAVFIYIKKLNKLSLLAYFWHAIRNRVRVFKRYMRFYEHSIRSI